MDLPGLKQRKGHLFARNKPADEPGQNEQRRTSARAPQDSSEHDRWAVGWRHAHACQVVASHVVVGAGDVVFQKADDHSTQATQRQRSRQAATNRRQQRAEQQARGASRGEQQGKCQGKVDGGNSRRLGQATL